MTRMIGLCAGVALMSATMAVASTASSLVAGDHLGTGWGAVPPTADVVGTGAGAILLTRLFRRHDRRTVLALGYGIAAFSGALGAVAAVQGNVPVLTLAMLLLGLGNAAAQLSRYAAAELYPPGRRGFAIGLVVWSAAVGAVGGPLLLEPSGRVAGTFGLTTLAGPFVFAAVTAAIAAFGMSGRRLGVEDSEPSVPLRSLFALPSARTALPVMVTAQVVMFGVMTAAPVDMHMHGDGLAAVGTTLAAHTLGMFALSPLTGRAVDRFGAWPVTRAGLVVLVVSTALAGMFPDARMLTLFLLGYGWNLCFVGGSALLAVGLPPAESARLEGAVDAAVWSLAAIASLLSTVVLAHAGARALAFGAATLALVVLAGQQVVSRPASSASRRWESNRATRS
ncbi:MFS transporter [Actinomadura oligospora]|uniref:MFS transporter n=1 Tax=Actinomadura oligospora TaxID=111804 RepID=UPI000684B89D|nr:MFS transporter [Actinomadura oligospora]